MKRTIFCLIAVQACRAQSTMVYADPKTAHLNRVCVLPAEANLTRIGMKGGENLVNESDQWAAKLAYAVSRAIVDAGGELKGDFSAAAMKDEDTRQSVLRLRQKYANISVQMRKKRDGVKKGRYTLGDEVALLPCAAQADSVVFIDGAGAMQTGGRKTFSVLTGGIAGPFMAMSRYQVWIALADAKTGKVTALLLVTSAGGKTGSDPEQALNKTLVPRFKKFRQVSTS